MKKILVIGAAGFIGSHLSEALLRRGHQVVGLDNLSYGVIQNLSGVVEDPHFEFVHGDVRDSELLLGLGSRVETIVHLAAYKIPRYGNALETLAVNVKGTENVLKIAEKHSCQVLFASTSDIYGKNPNLPYGEKSDFYMGSPQIQRWSYAISKILGEHLCYLYGKERGARITILRYFGSYGPRQNLTWWGGPQSIFIDCALKKRPMPIHGDGLQTRSFTYIQDTIEGTLLALEREGAIGRAINIGNVEEVSIFELAKKIWKLVRGPEEAQIEFVPYRQFPGRYEDVRRRVPDVQLAKELLDFVPKTSIDQGLIPTIDWQRAITKIEQER
ncbi:MAG: NAD-dependent epimerase/dehydratase family protein [Thermodesulfobacteriota bacterium]